MIPKTAKKVIKFNSVDTDNSPHTPLVSVVIATYNRADLIGETIDSILRQTFTDFELIIVSDGSTDRTEDVVLAYSDPRVSYIWQEASGRPAVPRNRGIREAKGKYIAFCDDDDLWMVDKLEKQVNLLELNSDAALCYTHAESFMGETTLAKRLNRRNVRKNHFYQLLRGNYIPNSSVIIRNDIIQVVGLLTEDLLLREDYEMWLRIAKLYRIQGIEASLIRYRVHSRNIAGNRASETLRAIRTVKSVINSLNIPIYQAWPNIMFQYAKYLFYRFKLYPLHKYT